MIAYVRGSLVSTGSDFVIVEAGGLGYRIYISAATFQRLPAIGQEVKIFTYHHVREDAMVLFGFLMLEEYEIFMHLIGISGIGPKGALVMLGALPPQQFIQAVVSGDVNVLTQISGVGKKTAQRLVLELKDKLSSLSEGTGVVPPLPAELAATGQNEAYEALLALGYTSQEATSALTEARRVSAPDASSDSLVRQALRIMMREVK